MIVILGVGHVFKISEQVRDIVLSERPDAVCVELDPQRYQALVQPRGRSDAQAAYKLLAAFQRRLAQQYGGEVGSEMLAATKAAQEIGAAVLFIDLNAASMFRRLWHEMPFKEKLFLGASAFTSMFLTKERVEKELENFQENEEEYLASLEKQFPTLKRMLIDERNEIMANRIQEASQRYPKVLAVVGDGHVEGILKLLSKEEVRVYRLKEIRGRKEGDSGAQSNSQIEFHFEYSDHPH